MRRHLGLWGLELAQLLRNRTSCTSNACTHCIIWNQHVCVCVCVCEFRTICLPSCGCTDRYANTIQWVCERLCTLSLEPLKDSQMHIHLRAAMIRKMSRWKSVSSIRGPTDGRLFGFSRTSTENAKPGLWRT